MSDWEDEDFTPPPVAGAKNTSAKKDLVKDSWDDEEAPATKFQVKGQWDDEDAAPEPEPPKPKVEAKKPAAKPAPKKAAKVNSAYVSTGDPLADKMREQRLVEAADYQNVEDMFGIERKPEEGEDATGGEELLNSKPKTELEYDTFAKDLVKRLQVHETSFHYPYFVKTITKQLCSTFTKPEDIKEIITALNVLVNEKLKSDKPKATKSKKAAGPTAGKKLYKEAFDDFDTKGKYNDDDDDDFM